MNLIENNSLDKNIFKKLQKKGMTKSEALQLIMCEIYYLNYKDRAVMRHALNFIGEEKKDIIIRNIHINKRKNYLDELKESEAKYEKVTCNYLFGY
ncbi:hypothetical protein [Aliivibrio salmonicida]|uniref:hypothetical protein n=1 Tax=Aliivibrio salmonicida TaxID=40269 RepID=UPI003D0BA6C6